MSRWDVRITRRDALLAGLAGSTALVGCGSSMRRGRPTGTPSTPPTSASLAPAALLPPDSRPYPNLPPGTDTLPQIEHIIMLMMENHSFDNYLGMLGRGDGFRLGPDGRPTAVNVDARGRPVRAFQVSTTCQQKAQPSQTWNDSHIQFDGGRNDGFVRSASGPIAMAYWTETSLPFYYGLARTFPLADRYFSSVLAQTFPNRRFLMTATAYGLVGDPLPSLSDRPPPNGTIFDRLNGHQIAWKNYYSTLASTLLIPTIYQRNPEKVAPIAQFFTDAGSGMLPGVALVDPDFQHGSEENPQNIAVGEVFAARIVNAIFASPAWSKTLLIWCYDEHGGYYDHVPPPRAVPPDSIPPDIHVPPDQPGSYNRYGFRVPCVVVSPYARRDYLSHVVHDHTSILKLIETKWNLPALTYRDANASNLLDCVDLQGAPAFREPPSLPAPNTGAAAIPCPTTSSNPSG